MSKGVHILKFKSVWPIAFTGPSRQATDNWALHWTGINYFSLFSKQVYLDDDVTFSKKVSLEVFFGYGQKVVKSHHHSINNLQNSQNWN